MLPTLSLEFHHFSDQFVPRLVDEHYNAPSRAGAPCCVMVRLVSWARARAWPRARGNDRRCVSYDDARRYPFWRSALLSGGLRRS